MSVRTEMIERLRALGDDRTIVQDYQLESWEAVEAANTRHDERVRREHERG